METKANKAETVSRAWPAPGTSGLFALLAVAASLGLLWYRLLAHLHFEWSVNPQYSYGWAVPFLCAYLLWRNVKRVAQSASPLRLARGEGRGEMSLPRSPPSTSAPQALSPSPGPLVSGPVVLWSLALCALLYLPTRLIQEANPEWRLVSWALALEVVAITLLLLRITGYGPLANDYGLQTTDHGPQITHHASRITHHASRFTFPICFFLVAVPWPTLIEGPLIQGLTRANAATTVEVLGFLGVPAVQHGNLIEVATGMVGVDDACSGIRSFQATLMLSLFFGELYRLTVLRRVVCVLAGFGLSFMFNVGRTTLLTWVAADKGLAAISRWHDPAGVTILVGCFVCLWLIARGLTRKAEILKTEMLKSSVQRTEVSGSLGKMGKAESEGGKAEKLKSETLKSLGQRSEGGGQRTEDRGQHVAQAPSPASPGSFSVFQPFSICLLAWLLLAEGGTELWYRAHEAHLAPPVTWSIALPKDNASLREIPLPPRTRQLLRYDEALNASWEEPPNARYQAIFLRWNAGVTAVHLARGHTPEVCLTAAGRELVSKPEMRIVVARGLKLPVRSYVFKDSAGPVHVYYCLWEDRAPSKPFTTATLSYENRLDPVLAGRRHLGQRSLELALWGIPDDEAAQAAFERQLERLIRP